jgi:hypothetical protein
MGRRMGEDAGDIRRLRVWALRLIATIQPSSPMTWKATVPETATRIVVVKTASKG